MEAEEGAGPSPVRVVAWQAMGWPSTEYSSLSSGGDGWMLAGDVATVLEDRPVHARYAIRLDSRWATRSADLVLQDGGIDRILALRAGEDGGWRAEPGRDELGWLNGCVDVDLEISPSTNLLPIRRLGLDVGQAADISAAWIRFPGLTVDRSEQRYTRLAERTWRYESGSVSAELEVDEDGLVVTYQGVWERVASAPT